MTIQQSNKWGHEQVGTHENPYGSNVVKYWDTYHDITGAPAYQHSPWCGCYAVVRAKRGGLDVPANWIGVYAIQSWGEEHNRWHRGSAGIKAGDQLVIGGPGVHTETAVEDVRSDGSVLTNGGNTTPGAGQGQFNGGAVAEKVRYAGEVYGYVRMHDLYPGGGGTRPKPGKSDRKPAVPQFRREDHTGPLHQWETGPRVEAMQRALGVAADGYYGHGTARAVAAFEKRHGMDADGSQASLVTLERLASVKNDTRVHVTLHKGDKGGLVRRMQRLLNAALPGHDIKDDGDYGDNTAEAVEAYKRANSKHFSNHDGAVAGEQFWKVID